MPSVNLQAIAADWPQLLGPNRDGAAIGEKLHAAWGDAGPKVEWEVSVRDGFSGVAVAGDRVIVFDREEDNEVVRCLSAATGKSLWQSKTGCSYHGGVSSDVGPRCVPLIAGDRVFTFGVEGLLRCLSLDHGKEIWRRDTKADYSPPEGYFGVGSTPVLFRDRLIANVGGRDGASVVAFSTEKGETLWETFTDAASYSSPIITSAGGSDLAVVVTRLHVVGIEPSSGKQVFSIPFGARGPTVNGASPVVVGEDVFLSSSYNIGALLIDLDKSSAKERWRDEELLATQYATPVPQAPGSSILYAIDGRQDAGSGTSSLKCIDVSKRKVLWEKGGLNYGSLIRVNDELLLLTCMGELIRAAASTEGYREVARAEVLSPTDRGYRLPALSNGRLFVRDDNTLKCLDVGPHQ